MVLVFGCRILKECLRGWRLRIIVSAYVAADILALIEIVVMHVLFHLLVSNNDASIGITGYVGISYVLSVDASSAIDHGQLLRIEVVFGVCSKTATYWFLVIVLIVAYRVEIRQLLLFITYLVVSFFLVRVDS